MKFGRIQIASALLVGLSTFAAFAVPGGGPEFSDVLVPEGEPYEKIRPLLEETDRGALVLSVAFSPDGSMLAVGSADKTLRLWDVMSGRECARFEGHSYAISSVAFSPDGRTLASGSLDRTIRLWDVASGHERARFEGRGQSILSIAFSPDGRTLASGSLDSEVILWDVASGRERSLLVGHGNSVLSVAFSPDGYMLASGSSDSTVRLWDLASGHETARLEHKQVTVSTVAFSPDGRMLATGSSDGKVRLWDVASRREREQLEGHLNSVLSVAFSPDARTVVSGSADKSVRLWDVASGRERARLRGTGGWSVAISPDGGTVASGSDEKIVRLWDVTSGTERALLEGHNNSVLSLAFSRDGSMLASGSWDHEVRLWEVASGRELAQLEGHSDSVLTVAFSPDGRTLASGSLDKTVRLWDIATRREIALLQGHSDSVRSVAFSPDGHTLASGSLDNTVRLWDVVSRRERARLEDKGFWVSFSLDGPTQARGSRDRMVQLLDLASGRARARFEVNSFWISSNSGNQNPFNRPSLPAARQWENVAKGRQRVRIVGHGNSVLSVAFSPDGRTLASASLDHIVRLWDVASGRERARLEGHRDSVLSVAFSPDGATLASGSLDQTVRLWSVARGHERSRLEGHRDSVISVEFSPDGRTLASGSDDKMIRLWDVAGGHEKAHFEGHRDSILSVTFSPDGNTLASGSDDQTLRLWDLVSEAGSLHDDNRVKNWSASKPAGEKAIVHLGSRKLWASCVAAQANCFRYDDGTLIGSLDAWSHPTPLLPPGAAQPLAVFLAEPLPNSSQKKPTILADPAEVLRLKVSVWNRGQGRAFWVRAIPAAGDSSEEWTLEPGAAIPIVEAGSPATLDVRVHLLARPANPTVFDTTIRLAVAQAYGDPVLVEAPIRVQVVPPVLRVEEAVLLGDSGQRRIAVTLQNTGRAIGALAFRLNVPGLSRQPAELTQERIDAPEKVTLSFGIDPGEKLPSDLKASLIALTVKGPADSGLPIYDWEFKDISVGSAVQWGLYAAALTLLLALAIGIHYQRTYRNPTVVRLTASPPALREVELGDVGEATHALKRASRLEPVLRAAKVDPSWIDAATGLIVEPGGEVRLAILAKRLGLPIEPAHAAGLPSLTLPPEFPLNLPRLRLRGLGETEAPQDVFNELSRAGEVTMVLGATRVQRRELSTLARRQPGMLVAPDGSELTRLMLADDPTDELARLIARYVPVTQISPYQTGAGVHRQVLFFGRAGILAQVMGRDPANYLIVGGRQVGKSSVLKEVQRRYQGHTQTDCRYLVLTGAIGIAPMAGALGLSAQSGLADLLDEFRLRGRRHTLFLLDEADVFIENERQHGYETLQALRALSEEGHAHFMLAGFWSLYRQAALDYQSPLKNFGSVLTLGALEREACKALAVEPMERLGVRWESDVLVDKLIEQTGQRANLISIACDEVLYGLGVSERKISEANLDAVLAGNRVRDALLGWADLSANKDESRIDRIVVYATVDRESFNLADLLTTLEEAGYAADPENIKNSLARLELAFVLGRRGNEYSYQVPLQRDLIRADDTRQLLRTEIRAALA